jgi:hypothetical protein
LARAGKSDKVARACVGVGVRLVSA